MQTFLPNMPAIEMVTATRLTLTPYTPTFSGIPWDNAAFYSTSRNYALLYDNFVFSAKLGATYDIFSSSFFDPFILVVYDRNGTPVRWDDGTSSYGTDYVFDLTATYTGDYYFSASWDQGSYYKFVSVSVYEDVDTIPPALVPTSPTSPNAPQTVIGTAADDQLVAGPGNDVMRGLAGNDTLTGGAGSDTIDGGPGTDTAVVSGRRSDYTVSTTATGVTIVDNVANRNGTDNMTGVEFVRFSDTTERVWTDPTGLALANQIITVYLGRGVSRDFRNATADALGSGSGITAAVQSTFFNHAINDGAFNASDSLALIVNKTFLNMFGVSASTFEQFAWANMVTAGAVTKEALPWAMFVSYLGANNVPPSYQIPAQSRIVAVDAFSNALTGIADVTIGSIGAGKAGLARNWLLPIRSQADAASKVSSAATDASSISSGAQGYELSGDIGLIGDLTSRSIDLI